MKRDVRYPSSSSPPTLDDLIDDPVTWKRAGARAKDLSRPNYYPHAFSLPAGPVVTCVAGLGGNPSLLNVLARGTEKTTTTPRWEGVCVCSVLSPPLIAGAPSQELQQV
jgi:hypothetical protein